MTNLESYKAIGQWRVVIPSAQELLAERCQAFTAVLSENDDMAIGAMKAFTGEGLQATSRYLYRRL